MKQTASPQEKNENFSQIANVLIQGYPELDIQDRYVPIALASVCWEEKFYPLSLRQIASITRVNHTALRSRAGQHPREGVLDRLKRVGILDFREEKPTDPTTGKEGRSQTYICIRYSNIWRENTKFFAGKKAVKIAASVDHVNSDTHVSVDTDNTCVDVVNHTVDTVNVSVDVVNHTVDGACSNAAHNTINTKKTINTIEDKAVFANAPTPCDPSSHLPEKKSFSQEQQSFAYSQNKPTTNLQEESTKTDVLVERGDYKQKTLIDAPEKPTKSTSKSKVEQAGLPLQVDLGPLVMPASDAPWNASTAVIVSEVLRDKRYTPMQRDNQINTAKRMVKAFPDMTRAQFETVFADWAKWWREHDKGFFTLADLMCKGKNNEVRLQSALDRLEAQKNKPATTNQPTSQAPQQHVRASSPNTAGFQPLTDEDRKRNIEKAKAMVAAKKAAQAAASQVTAAAI